MTRTIRSGNHTVDVIIIIALAVIVWVSIDIYRTLTVLHSNPKFVSSLFKGFLQPPSLKAGDQIDPASELANDLYVKLLDLSAENHAATSADKLHIVLLKSFSASSEASSANPLAKSVRKLRLDLSQTGDTALLIVTDHPLIVELIESKAQISAKLALESPYVIDLQQMPTGVLAGFHIDAFGAISSTTPQTLRSRNKNPKLKRSYCNFIGRWSSFFQVPSSNFQIWEASAPNELQSTADNLFTEQGTKLHRWPHVPKC